MARQKLLPKTQWKKSRRKEYIVRASRIALVASLKTLHEKNPVGKNSSRKKSTTIDARVRSSQTDL
jgi:hypothetical protein